MTAAATNPPRDLRAEATRHIRAKRNAAIAIPAVIVAYLLYIFFAFDVPGLVERARMDNAAILVADSYSYKTHVTRDNRSGEMEYALEGEARGRYPEGETPDWVSVTDTEVVVDLDNGHVARFLPDERVIYEVPGFGSIDMRLVGRDIVTNLPEETPDWISASGTRIDITTDAGRVTFTRSKSEVFRYFFGWEQFWFTLDSPYHDVGVASILFGPQLDPARSNISGAWEDFWTNGMWRHADAADGVRGRRGDSRRATRRRSHRDVCTRDRGAGRFGDRDEQCAGHLQADGHGDRRNRSEG